MIEVKVSEEMDNEISIQGMNSAEDFIEVMSMIVTLAKRKGAEDEPVYLLVSAGERKPALAKLRTYLRHTERSLRLESMIKIVEEEIYEE